ncbi:PAS domain S-box-containing protein [Methylobacterium sp. PvP062]|uniref:response regulator n=1 Tax=Methylobacterium TaxID=407 RepID=UPI0007A5CA31|nr:MULTISPECIES: response regulator [unclassified Methylobacterium]KZB98283.1 Blue-light-activated protein [Methylobacterium radiotolerans]MCX7330007.1 response regulator [Hyphomicrobiales bacterium]MBP2494869.1 PAS domain S-box-containing protein [Methylobacterium sp. PvP105]MBP2505260.1 PAS domain S-box-containing protein [Methylobacterium sp. PvP109]RUP18027.1 MAG: response regulator [Methylobacterium sp.]
MSDGTAGVGTILAVDDEPDILIALEDLFEESYRVLTTSRPAEALEILRAEPDIAVVLSDQRMPGLTGDALLAEARTFHDAQAILLTGYADITAVIAALNRGGIVGYVTKPWDAGLLRSTVRQAFERHRLGRDLATERALLRGLLDHAQDAISFKDAAGRFVRLNGRKAALLGHDVAASLGRREDELLGPKAEAVTAADAAAVRSGAVAESLISDGPTGAEQWSHVTRVPIRDASGAISHLAMIERDVTEQRTLEARLRQSDKMQALGTLAGGIAHDFNNLLTAILGSLELAGPKVADQPRVQRLIENARGAAERGASLTKRLLSFSRAHDLQARPVDVNTLITGMSDLFGRSLGGLVTVRTDLEDGLPAVQVDPDQLELAVLNLCINARDAMPDGGAITVATRRLAISGDPEIADGPYLGISVTDEGTGIPEEILRRVCEPFFTTKAVGQGTGLGLAMVFGLAQQSKGRLVIDSVVGRGTRVELALPFADQAPEQAAEASGAVPVAGRRARVLIVDDDPQVRHVTASFLTAFGHSTTEAGDGEAALRLLQDGRYDIVVADLAMPGMSGIDLAAEIRDRDPGLPVLILTGHAEAMQIPDDLPVLTKPFRSADLAARVATLLDGGAEPAT